MQDLEPRVRALIDEGELNGAVEAVLGAHGPRLKGLVAAVLQDPGAADEVYAEACFDIYRGLPSWEGRGSLDAWVSRVGSRACLRFWRAQRRRQSRFLLVSSLGSRALARLADAVRRSPTPQWKTTPVRDAIVRLRERLEPTERLLLTLRVDRGLAWEEVARALNDDEAHLPSAAELARLRKRFERIVRRIARWARDEGLIT